MKTTVRVAVPVMVMARPNAVEMRRASVIPLFARRKPRVRMGNRRQLTGEQPRDHE
ncbi:MAG: hypothetical protein AB7F89_12150 [Pirellulaceae bacterium]